MYSIAIYRLIYQDNALLIANESLATKIFGYRIQRTGFGSYLITSVSEMIQDNGFYCLSSITVNTSNNYNTIQKNVA